MQAFASLVQIIYSKVKSLAAGTCKSTIQPVQKRIQQQKKRLAWWLRITHLTPESEWLNFYMERRVLLSSK